VFHYNPAGLGSRDIDLIFPDRPTKDRLINQYMLTHGYERERRSEFEENYVLPVTTSKGVERVYLDVAPLQDVNRVHGADVELPWKLVYDHQMPAKVGDVMPDLRCITIHHGTFRMGSRGTTAPHLECPTNRWLFAEQIHVMESGRLLRTRPGGFPGSARGQGTTLCILVTLSSQSVPLPR